MSDLSPIENRGLRAGRNPHSHPTPSGDEKRRPVRVTQLCAQASCLPRVRGLREPGVQPGVSVRWTVSVTSPSSSPGSSGRHCDAPDSAVCPPVKGSFPKTWLRFPAPRPPPSCGPGGHASQAFPLRRSPGPGLQEEQRRAHQDVVEEPVMVGTEQPDGGSESDSATCLHLTLVKYLMFRSFDDLIGKMETIIHTKKGFKNSVRMYGARAASRLGRIPPSHWRPLLFGFFQVLQAAPLPVGPCRTLPFGHLLTAFFGDPGCDCFPSR